MSELAFTLRNMHKMSTAVICYPSGKYGIVGSVPIELTEEAVSGFSVSRRSKVFDTEAEAIAALLAIGVTKFQLSDCSWYEEE
jgi:hypothetical protein